MKLLLAFCIAIFSLFAVVSQFDLMLSNSTNTFLETTVRFFSFFTILTNSLVAGYFSFLIYNSLKHKKSIEFNFATLTSITVYISIVGLVYQVLLRHAWNPVGLQKIVDEMLHSVNPTLVLLYWFINKSDHSLQYKHILSWLIYPLIYLVCVLVRGHFSNFYPYPFLNVNIIGFQKVIINSIGMTLLFIIISILFVWISKLNPKKAN
ncbi:Pr6Pr family membrane protein [Flavobacterium seoulense]|uniref:Integral membrane protein n=1 Tax=Flavobacterium seoulense TaxID=1492738 RepID=A0A066WSZ7_9FLAO|nr:Pr6Pr family membrane protein [Flavobacterium seoulense]KDN53790.1 hypothetical protein FEM21_31070 [Flavobacterium seoulense]